MDLSSTPNGLCGCVCAQLSGVEGLYTCDRAERKAPVGPMLALRADIGRALAAG